MVTNSQGEQLENVSVYCTNGSATLASVTNSAGRYEFLLTEGESRVATELRVGQNQRVDDNFVFFPGVDGSFPFESDFVWAP